MFSGTLLNGSAAVRGWGASGHGSSQKVGRLACQWEGSGKRAYPSQFWGYGVVTPGKIFENVGENLYNLVHFGV